MAKAMPLRNTSFSAVDEEAFNSPVFYLGFRNAVHVSKKRSTSLRGVESLQSNLELPYECSQIAAFSCCCYLCDLCHASTLSQQLEPKCVENSPERHGGIGCSYVENKVLTGTLKEPLYWHIDRFEDGEKARAAVGPDKCCI
ncbi:hypothetical protein [Alloacidobacterium sp.]|uniref:hypothetical protein n=1 Tax=Alloacidobacterium sp. TaxID=2951999 RepID=UPI002D41B957|nr:hypothetical protein [Alloacidobacterium sp.]HYK35681.1 hypothetical protein [Alloacidobacterium sp.]